MLVYPRLLYSRRGARSGLWRGRTRLSRSPLFCQPTDSQVGKHFWQWKLYPAGKRPKKGLGREGSRVTWETNTISCAPNKPKRHSGKPDSLCQERKAEGNSLEKKPFRSLGSSSQWQSHFLSHPFSVWISPTRQTITIRV